MEDREDYGNEDHQVAARGRLRGETAAAATYFFSHLFRVPVRRPHDHRAINGVGSVRGLSAVRWGIAGRIVWAWIFTIPRRGEGCFRILSDLSLFKA
jgi:phosphate/sulfate permease